MPEKAICVSVKVKNPRISSEFEDIFNSLDGVRLKKLEEAGPPDVLIIEITNDYKKEFEFIESLLSSGNHTKIFLTSCKTEPEILLQAMKMGITEFFSQPLKTEEIVQSFKRLKEKSKEAERGRIISVIAGKGGAGATTIAANLTTCLAQLREMQAVIVIDLNLNFGDIGICMDLEPRYTITEISKNIDRLDSTFLMGALTKHPSGVYVLPSPNNLEEADLVSPDIVERILNNIRTLFDFAIVDTGRNIDPVTVRTLDLSDAILLVSTLDLASLRNSKKLMGIFYGLGYPEEKIKLVINRYTKNSREVPLKAAEKALKRKAFRLIPNDYRTVISSIDRGSTLFNTAPKSKITKSFEKFASELLALKASEGREQVKKNEAGLLTRLLRR